MTDQLSAVLKIYLLGKQIPQILNMDYLAEHNVTYTKAYCANPLYIPLQSFISA